VPALQYPEPALSDGVVTLRAFDDADVSALATMMDDPEIARWTRVPSPYRERDALEWLASIPVFLRREELLPFAVTDAESGELVGSIALRFREEGRGELGYTIARWARRRGVATRAVRLLSRYSFEEQGVARLEVFVQPGNDASLALAEGLGFQREGLLRSHSISGGRRTDMVILGLLPGELRL
jgi:RimJ/RimL family protein N-acetyltransferase